MEPIKVSDMFWMNADRTAFSCVVMFAGADEGFPFACNSHEVGVYPHVAKIWAMAHSGEFGEIAKYVEPAELEPAVDAASTPPSGEIPRAVL